MTSITPSALIVQTPLYVSGLWNRLSLILMNRKLAGDPTKEYYTAFLTGRPVRLPFSLAADEAEEIAKELAAAGCLVKVVASGE